MKNESEKKGKLSCVGIGMCLGAHITPLAKSYIEKAEICYVAVSNKLVEEWVFSMNSNCQSLQPLYAKGKSRNQTYKEMEDLILSSVFSGKNVCCVFYGHPGIFAKAPHEVIKKAKNEGISATMVPGISAEDTLYADLGIDPGTSGCQHYEANHLLLYQKTIDKSSYLILWQIGLIGDYSLSEFEHDTAALNELVLMLTKMHGSQHEVIIYEAKTIPLESVRADYVKLEDLAKYELHNYSTLVIPPSQKPEPRKSDFGL